MNRRKTRLAALSALLPTLLWGCGDGSAAEASEDRSETGASDIVIAAAWPWQNRQEILFREGMEMAIDEVNAAGGIRGRRLLLLTEDDNESVNEGLRVAQRLASRPEVTAVVGHLQSYVTVPAAAIYENAGRVLIAPTSTDPELTAKGYRNVFRTIFTDHETGRQMARYAQQQGYRRVAIYYVRSAYGRMLANAFEEQSGGLGLAIAARASYEPTRNFDARTFESTLRQWRQLEIDAIFLAAEVPLAGQLIAEMRRHGLDQPVLGGDAMSVPELMRAGGAAVEGTVVASAFHSGDPRPEAERFVQAFQERHGVEPDPGAALGYDAVQVLSRGLMRATSTAPDALAEAIREMPVWEGATGPISFDEQGDLRSRRMTMLVVREGRFETLPATVEPDP